MPIDIFDFLKEFNQERYRAMIIHTDPMNSPALTQFAKKVCNALKGKYIDLLNEFVQSRDLSQTIDRFTPEKLREFLSFQSRSQSLVVIDKGDFLLDTWTDQDRKAFFRMVDKQWDSYREGMRAGLIFCLQTSIEIETASITDSQGRSRILRLSDFNDIP